MDALGPALVSLAAAGIGITPTARASIDGHVRLLLAWNEAINLTAITDPAAVARLHVADSLAALPLLQHLPLATVLDLGSGGGFPGLPLAAVMPALRVTLVESVAKKAAFLETAVAALGLSARVDVVNARAEALLPGVWDVVLARAVGGLAELIELSLPLLAPGGSLLAWKRGDITAELAAGGRAAVALGGGRPTLEPHPTGLATAAGILGHVIVRVRKDAPTPAGYPRDRPARLRGPW